MTGVASKVAPKVVAAAEHGPARHAAGRFRGCFSNPAAARFAPFGRGGVFHFAALSGNPGPSGGGPDGPVQIDPPAAREGDDAPLSEDVLPKGGWGSFASGRRGRPVNEVPQGPWQDATV